MARIFADHMIPREVVERLRTFGHDAVASRDLALDDFADDVQILAAASTQRVLITHDIKDFEKLHDAWRRWSAAWQVSVQHAGILIVPQGRPVQETVDAIDRFIDSGVNLTNKLYRLRADGLWHERLLREAPIPGI
jgi:hypothetical protein